MTDRLNTFREIIPEDGHLVYDVEYNLSGEQFFVCCNSQRPRVYHRDGHLLQEFVRGDMYLFDMKHTKGHISGVTRCKWHPKDKSLVVTCGADGTARIWDVNDPDKNKSVIKVKAKNVPVTSCTYNSTGSMIGTGNGRVGVSSRRSELISRLVAASNDGSFQLWDSRSSFVRPTKAVDNARKSFE